VGSSPTARTTLRPSGYAWRSHARWRKRRRTDLWEAATCFHVAALLAAQSNVEQLILIHAHGPQRTGLSPILLLRRGGIGDQQRPARRPAAIARRAVQEIDIEQQDIASLARHALCLRT
jgi:hypothetical protein